METLLSSKAMQKVNPSMENQLFMLEFPAVQPSEIPPSTGFGNAALPALPQLVMPNVCLPISSFQYDFQSLFPDIGCQQQTFIDSLFMDSPTSTCISDALSSGVQSPELFPSPCKSTSDRYVELISDRMLQILCGNLSRLTHVLIKQPSVPSHPDSRRTVENTGQWSQSITQPCHPERLQENWCLSGKRNTKVCAMLGNRWTSLHLLGLDSCSAMGY